MKNILKFKTNNNTFYDLSENISDSSEYGGSTLKNVAKAKLWTTCYVQFLNYLRVFKELTKEQIVLDVGCGQAELLTVIRNNMLTSRYIGIEINGKNLKESKHLFRRPEREILLKHDITIGLPIEDNTIDVVTCNLVLEHLPKLKSFFVFKELVRVCKPDGLIMILMPIRKPDAPNKQPKHIYEWTKSDIIEQVKKNDLILLQEFFANVYLRQLYKTDYANVVKKLQGKINPIFIRTIFAPLCNDGQDIFIKLQKRSNGVL